jgi:hypothetical protein
MGFAMWNEMRAGVRASAWAVAVAFGLVGPSTLAACGDDDDGTETGSTETAGPNSDGAGTTGDTQDTSATGPDTAGTETDPDTDAGTDAATTGDTGNTDDTGDTGDTGGPAAGRKGCNPLAPEVCMLPFPANHFTKPDTTAATGLRLWVDPQASPKNKDGTPVYNPEADRRDGFASIPRIMTVLPADVVFDDDTPDIDHPERSLLDTSTTLLIDAESGEKQPHFTEIDHQLDRREGTAKADDSRRILFVQALNKLEHGRRYIVAIRRLKDTGGAVIEPTGDFKALREGRDPQDPVLLAEKADYARVFADLTDAGIDTDDLQQAWDFTVASESNLNGRFLKALDQALALLPASGPVVTVKPEDIETFTPEQDRTRFKRIRGTVRTPLFLNDAFPDEGFRYDEKGDPTANDKDGNAVFTEVPFTLLVPHAAKAGGAVGVQFGHGLFASQSQVDSGSLWGVAQDYNRIMYACDWWGLSSRDLSFLAGSLALDFSQMPVLQAQLTQGLINHAVLDEAVLRTLADSDLLKENGQPMLDSSSAQFWGISAGAILGTIHTAVSPRVEKAVLSVGGVPFAVLLERSWSFKSFFAVMDLGYPRIEDQLIALQVAFLLWEPIEGSTYIDRLLTNPLPGRPAQRTALFHVSLKDELVTNVASLIQARTLGLPLLTPVNRAQPGLDEVAAPVVNGSALQDIDVGSVEMPKTNASPTTPDNQIRAHSQWQTDAINRQVGEFLKAGGQIINVCDGACDPQ